MELEIFFDDVFRNVDKRIMKVLRKELTLSSFYYDMKDDEIVFSVVAVDLNSIARNQFVPQTFSFDIGEFRLYLESYTYTEREALFGRTYNEIMDFVRGI